MTEDIVAGVLRQWQQVHPGLDTGPMAVIGRLNRCSALLQQAADAPLRKAGLTRPEFDILGTLRRMDRELTPGRVARETFASGAAVTKRVRQLEERGLISAAPTTGTAASRISRSPTKDARPSTSCCPNSCGTRRRCSTASAISGRRNSPRRWASCWWCWRDGSAA